METRGFGATRFEIGGADHWHLSTKPHRKKDVKDGDSYRLAAFLYLTGRSPCEECFLTFTSTEAI
jgi:hypothetical protein